MVSYYSIRVYVDDHCEIPLQECGQLLEQGMNAFTHSTDNIAALLEKIRDGGGRIIACDCLDSSETIEPIPFEQFAEEVMTREEFRSLCRPDFLDQDPQSSEELSSQEGTPLPVGGDIDGGQIEPSPDEGSH